MGVGALDMFVDWCIAMGGAVGIIAMACCCWYAMGGCIEGGAIGGAGLYCGIMGGRTGCMGG